MKGKRERNRESINLLTKKKKVKKCVAYIKLQVMTSPIMTADDSSPIAFQLFFNIK